MNPPSKFSAYTADAALASQQTCFLQNSAVKLDQWKKRTVGF